MESSCVRREIGRKLGCFEDRQSSEVKEIVQCGSVETRNNFQDTISNEYVSKISFAELSHHSRRRKRRLHAVGFFLQLAVSPIVIEKCVYHHEMQIRATFFTAAHSPQTPSTQTRLLLASENGNAKDRDEENQTATTGIQPVSSPSSKGSMLRNLLARAFQPATGHSSFDSDHDFLQYINDSVEPEPEKSAPFLSSSSSHLSAVGGGSVAVASASTPKERNTDLIHATPNLENDDTQNDPISHEYNSEDPASPSNSFLQSHLTDLVHQATEKMQHLSQLEPISIHSVSLPIEAHHIIDGKDEARRNIVEAGSDGGPVKDPTIVNKIERQDDTRQIKAKTTTSLDNQVLRDSNSNVSEVIADEDETPQNSVKTTPDNNKLEISEEELITLDLERDPSPNLKAADDVAGAKKTSDEKEKSGRGKADTESLFEDEESMLYYFNDDLTEDFDIEEPDQVKNAELEYPATEEFTLDYEKDGGEDDSDWSRLPPKVPFIVKQDDETNASDENYDEQVQGNKETQRNGSEMNVQDTEGTKPFQTTINDGEKRSLIQRPTHQYNEYSPSSSTTHTIQTMSAMSDDDVETEDEEDSDFDEDEVNIGQNLWDITTDAAKEVYSLGLHGAREFIETYRQQKREGITDKPLRPLRKATSKVTGLQGFFSGKQKRTQVEEDEDDFEVVDDDELGIIRRRIAAIDMARQAVERKANADTGRRRFGFGKSVVEELTEGKGGGNASRVGPIRWLGRRLTGNRASTKQLTYRDADHFQQGLTESQGDILFREFPSVLDAVAQADAEARRAKTVLDLAEERKRRARIKEIDRQITMGQELLVDLQSERDKLFRRPNPLFNYTKVKEPETDISRTTRVFNFPPPNLVDEYLDQLLTNERLIMLNHTYLWKQAPLEEDFDDDDTIGDDLFTPSADARKLYEKTSKSRNSKKNKKSGSGNSIGGGSWLLRQSIGKGESLGEKIGSVMEMATYKAVCKSVMAVLARSIASLHGLNVMGHSDIRIYMENSPDLPPHTDYGDSDTYAQEMMKRAIRKGNSAKGKKKGKRRSHHFDDNRDPFVQRDAVVETMLSHCQISAPLLKLFPLPWQRAFLSNIVTLVSAIVSDFASGLRIQVLGHQLTFSFQPITEEDMMEQALLDATNPPPFNNRKARPHAFEAAVTATANDLSEQLMFLDRWHERALGSGMLRAQLSNLIARIVLTIIDEVLSGTQMNMWTKQASGPRIVAGLEYRAETR